MNLGRGEFGVSILRGSYTERRGGARNVSSSILIHQLTGGKTKAGGDVLSVCCPIIFVKYLLCEELRSR